MTPVVKELWIVNLPFHDSLYCWGRHAFKIPTRGESMSRPEQNAAVNNGIFFIIVENNDKENNIDPSSLPLLVLNWQ